MDDDGNQKDSYKLTYAGNSDGKTASDIPEDGEVLPAAFTQNLKDTEWKNVDKSHSDAEESADVPPRGGVVVPKFNYNSDDYNSTGDSKLEGAKFAIINVSEEAVQNKDGDDIPTWKYHGYNGESDFTSLKWNAVRAAANNYMVQEIEVKNQKDPLTGEEMPVAITGIQDLPFGDYLVIETVASKGYHLNKEWIGRFSIREDSKYVRIHGVTGDDHNVDAETWRVHNGLPAKYEYDDVACRNHPYEMGIAIEKLDREMKRPFAQGKSSLKGAMYAVINASDYDVVTKDGVKHATIQSMSGYSNDAVSYKYLYDIYRNDIRYATFPPVK